MISTDIIIPLWQATSSEEINISLASLKKEIDLITRVIIVCDGENSFFKNLKEDKKINDKILIIYVKKNMGPGIARNIGAFFSNSEKQKCLLNTPLSSINGSGMIMKASLILVLLNFIINY